MKGFSLIELLIVIAITAILASFAYPSYENYLIKIHRLDGQTALIDLANRMEQSYAKELTYTNATISKNPKTDVLASNLSAEGHYILSIEKATDTTYNLKATPIGAEAMYDLDCQSLTFNNVGVKGITNGPKGTPLGSIEKCWS